jgi:hemolysin D
MLLLTNMFQKIANINKHPLPIGRGRETEFLPAVLEIQETPASPLGRVVGAVILLIFLFVIIWASFGHIDIVAVAQGKIIPSDHSKIIQPLEAGVVKGIHVRDGQFVHRGDLLIELDPTAAGAEEGKFINEKTASLIEAARLRALIAGKETFEFPEQVDPAYINLQRQLLIDQLKEYRARSEQVRLVMEQKQSGINSIKANIVRLEAIVPILEKRAQKFKQLLEQSYVSELQYLEVEEQRVTKVQELVMERHHVVQETAALTEAQRNHQAIQSEFKNKWQAELSAVETRATSLGNEVLKAGTRTRQQKLTAPIDGVVQQMAIHTIGGVVTPAQQLLVVAPNEGQIEVEAFVENKDIGFVEAGQVAEVKIDAFPFTRYGLIPGKVLHLSQDAVPVDKLGLMYTARISLQDSVMQIDNGKNVKLAPGMTVVVEIKTGSRRLIEYFLSPLLKGVKETARER